MAELQTYNNDYVYAPLTYQYDRSGNQAHATVLGFGVVVGGSVSHRGHGFVVVVVVVVEVVVTTRTDEAETVEVVTGTGQLTLIRKVKLEYKNAYHC